MAVQRAGLDGLFTQGFNPKPKLEFLNPITMGVTGLNELLLCELPISQANQEAIERLNNALAEGFIIKDITVLPQNATGKKISLASKLKGCEYEITDIQDESITQALEDALYKEDLNFKVIKNADVYSISINGDKNIFKLFFPSDMNQFHI